MGIQIRIPKILKMRATLLPLYYLSSSPSLPPSLSPEEPEEPENKMMTKKKKENPKSKSLLMPVPTPDVEMTVPPSPKSPPLNVSKKLLEKTPLKKPKKKPKKEKENLPKNPREPPEDTDLL